MRCRRRWTSTVHLSTTGCRRRAASLDVAPSHAIDGRRRGSLTGVRRCAVVALSVVLVAASASCGDPASTRESSVTSVESVDLPFGLTVVDGTEPIGRPAVVDEPAFSYNGQPVDARRLRAAFWVTARDPVAVVHAWVEQLDQLALDQVTIRRSLAGPEHWIDVTGGTAFVPDEPSGDRADLELWATSRGPVLLVSIDRIRGEPRQPVVTDELGDAPEPSATVEQSERSEGDVLLTEQGDTLHLPEGSRSLMPTIPTSGGTGGSTSVLAAPDPVDAVVALLDEAAAVTENGETTGPTESTVDGVDVVTGSFVITAGGWEFRVVAARAPDDDAATVYVTSAAD